MECKFASPSLPSLPSSVEGRFHSQTFINIPGIRRSVAKTCAKMSFSGAELQFAVLSLSSSQSFIRRYVLDCEMRLRVPENGPIISCVSLPLPPLLPPCPCPVCTRLLLMYCSWFVQLFLAPAASPQPELEWEWGNGNGRCCCFYSPK